MYDDIINSLKGASRVFVSPIFAAGEPVDNNYTAQSISEDIKNILQINAEPYFNDKIVESLISNTQKKAYNIINRRSWISSKLWYGYKEAVIWQGKKVRTRIFSGI